MWMTIYFLYYHGIWQCQHGNLEGCRLVINYDVNVSSIFGIGVRNTEDFWDKTYRKKSNNFEEPAYISPYKNTC